MAPAITAPRLGDWLLDRKILSRTQLDLALREQRRHGRLLGETLIGLGFVSQAVLAEFLALKTQTESMDLRRIVVSAEVLGLVDEGLARRLVALPIAREGNTLRVAIADPLNVTAFDLLEQATGLSIRLLAASEGEILEAQDRLYGSRQSVEALIDELLRLGNEQLALATETDAPTIRLADRLLLEAASRGASDIHLHPEDRYVRIRLRCDGRLDPGYLIPKSLQAALTARLKILGGMDIAENRRTQEGRGAVSVGGREIGLRFSSLPTAFGESVVIRLLDRGAISFDLEALGFQRDLERRFRGLIEAPHGVVLVTGPTGSGKTTTLYTALSLLDAAERSVFTLEDPVEYALALVRQTQINEAAGLTFAEGLRTLLRQDPDVILVGETRDVETAQLMVRAALTGHLVFTTLHTNDALGAIARLRDLGVPPYLLAPTLRGMLAQRLVRRLCPECCEADPKAVDLIQGLPLPVPQGVVARPARACGCAACRGTGFRGRLGIYEICVVDAALQAVIAEDGDRGRLEAAARQSGLRPMLEDGIEKAWAGRTTLEEVLRATGT